MFRLWGKMWKDNHMLKDLVIDDDSEDTRTHKIFHALQKSAMILTWRTQFGWKVIFLISNAIQRPDFARTVFIEHIEFDYLEIR